MVELVVCTIKMFGLSYKMVQIFPSETTNGTETGEKQVNKEERGGREGQRWVGE